MSAGPNRRGRVPFNSKAGFRQHSAKEQSAVHPALLKQARQSGQLNLSGRNLETGTRRRSQRLGHKQPPPTPTPFPSLHGFDCDIFYIVLIETVTLSNITFCTLLFKN